MTTETAEEVEIQVGPCSKTPSVHVPRAGGFSDESSLKPTKDDNSPAGQPECAPTVTSIATADDNKNESHQKKNESFVDRAASAPDMASRGMKSLTGKINKINRQHRALKKSWKSLQRALATLSKNAKGVLSIFGGRA
jgi:hypothetical protein